MAWFGKKKDGGTDGSSTDAPTAPAKKGFFGRLVGGLRKTFGTILGGLGSLIGRKVDDDLIDDVEMSLLGADIGPDLTDEIIKRLKADWRAGRIKEGEEIVPFLKKQFVEILESKPNAVAMAEAGPTVILVVGVNGTGKTTSIGKLAWHYTQAGKKVMIAACDTFRAAAEQQLEIWANERIGCAFHKGPPKSDPSAVAYQAAERALDEGIDILIVDTAGRLHTDQNLMKQLDKIRRVVGKKIEGAPHETLLVVDANYGQNVIAQTEKFSEAAGVTGLFLAKLDATGKGGVVLNIHQRFEVPVKFVGLGEQKEDYAPFDPTGFVDALFESGEKSG